MVKKNKKAGMELSLNLIIMLIIGLVVLGLVITFVQQMMTDATDQFSSSLTEQEQKKLDEVKAHSENFAVLPQPELKMRKGEAGKLYMKIRYTGSTSAGFSVGMGKLANPITVAVSDENGATATNQFTFTSRGFDVKPGEVGAEPITVKTTANPGIYYIKFTANQLDGSTDATTRATIIVE